MHTIPFLIDRLNSSPRIAISFIGLSGSASEYEAGTKISHHIGSLCLAAKDKAGGPKAGCIRYKTRKFAMVQEKQEPSFSICPYGIVDYLSFYKGRGLSYILCVTCDERAFIHKAQPEHVRILGELEVRKMGLDEYIEECKAIETVLRATLPAMLPPPKPNTRSLSSSAYQARNMIAEHSESELTLSSLARDLEMDPGLLARTYKKAFGVTVHHDLNRVRIGNAKQLMRSGRTVTQAAFESGYNDSSYFCRVFKKTTGMSPTEWLKTSEPVD